MSGYKTYRFRDKDPVIDILRTATQFAAEADGMTFAKKVAEISEAMGCRTPSMARGWFFGETRRPQHAGVQAYAKVLQHEFRYARVR